MSEKHAYRLLMALLLSGMTALVVLGVTLGAQVERDDASKPRQWQVAQVSRTNVYAIDTGKICIYVVESVWTSGASGITAMPKPSGGCQ
jgi:hypothetical protein